jgi:hypothetical protein
VMRSEPALSPGAVKDGKVGSGFKEDEVFGRVGEAHGLPVDLDNVVQPGRVRVGDHKQPIIAVAQKLDETVQ